MSIEQSLLVASAIRLYKIVSCLATNGTFVSCLRSYNIGTTSRNVVGFGICGVVFNGLMNLNTDDHISSVETLWHYSTQHIKQPPVAKCSLPCIYML